MIFGGSYLNKLGFTWLPLSFSSKAHCFHTTLLFTLYLPFSVFYFSILLALEFPYLLVWTLFILKIPILCFFSCYSCMSITCVLSILIVYVMIHWLLLNNIWFSSNFLETKFLQGNYGKKVKFRSFEQPAQSKGTSISLNVLFWLYFLKF